MPIVKHPQPFGSGLTRLAAVDGDHADMLMDFGILNLGAAERWESSEAKERALLLMTGRVRFSWDGEAGPETIEWERRSLLDEEPVALHMPAGRRMAVEALGGPAELAYQARPNDKPVPPRVWKPGEYRSDRFGEGTLQDTSTRTVRTIFDAATVAESEMVLGEVINFPGKWSSYPPHDHAHPEIYHYRFFPEHGFGHAEQEDEVFKVRSRDSYMIPPGVTHSQCAAPGYAMYYIWAIPHLPGDRFGPDSRIFRREHTWVMDPAAPIWPDADLATVQQHQEGLR